MSGAPPRARTAIEAVWPQTPHRRCRGRAPAAPLADRLPGGVAAGDRLDLAAVRAGGRELPGAARLAHARAASCGTAASRPGRSRAHARRPGRRPAGDQLGGQPPGHRRRAGRARRDRRPAPAASCHSACPAGRDRIDRGGRSPAGAATGPPLPPARPPVTAAARAAAAGAVKLMPGRAAASHCRFPRRAVTRARTGRGSGLRRRCLRRPAAGSRADLDEVTGLAAEDVAQRGQRGQAQPLRDAGDQPVDLLPGQH